MSPSFTPNWLSGAPAFVLWARRVSLPRDSSCARISLTVMPRFSGNSQVSVDLVVREPPGSHEPVLDTRRIPTSRDDLPVILADSPCRVDSPRLPFRITVQTNRRRSMNPIDALTAAAGQWLGTNTLQDPNTGQ